MFQKLIEWYKKFLRISIDITNFFLTFMIYFLGVSISHVLWRLAKKNNLFNAYWQPSRPLPKKLEEYLDQY